MIKDSKLNVAVMGLNMGLYHVEAYLKNKDARLIAICDYDKPWLDFCKDKFKPDYAYTDYKEMLANKEIDAVSVCLPTYLHAEAAIAALEAGKHVLCEKPMAVNAIEAQAMHNASVKAGKKLMISQNQRFGEDAQYLKKIVDTGVFGEIYFIRTGWRRPMGGMPGPFGSRENGAVLNRNWFNEKDKGGGVLRDLGSHMIDLAMYLTGFPKLVEASANCYRKFYPDGYVPGEYIVDSEDLAAGHIKFANGMSMQLEVSFGSQIEDEVYFTEIYGTKAGVSRRNGMLKFFKTNDIGGTVEIVKSYNVDSRGTQDRFIEAVLNGTEPAVTSAQGVEVIRILDAVYASAGKIV